MFKKHILLLTMIFILTLSAAAAAITAEEIINRRDDNEFYATARAEARMVVSKNNRVLEKTMISYVDGEKSFTEFTNPHDRGTKYLKKGDNLYMFFPAAEEIVPLSGHMLDQSMAGSDFSYRDMMESDKLTDLYNFEIIDENADYEGRPCYLLEGIKKEGKEDVSYYRRKIWIDKERYIGLKEELYAQSGTLLKESRVLEVEKIDGRYFPVRSIMEDKLIKNSSTEFFIESIEFNPEIPEGTFTQRNLRS